MILSHLSLKNKIVSKEHRFIYGVIQKNASTSVLATLNRMYYGESITGTPYEMMEAIPKNNKVCGLFCYSDEEIDEMLVDPHFYKFTTLRDPYQRFVSAYMTKLSNMPEFVEIYGISDDKINNLDNAIEYISNTPDESREFHFQSQHILGDFDHINYKRVMHVRNLYHNWNLLRKDKPTIPKLGAVRNSTNSADMIQVINNYHPTARDKIMDIYKIDYDLFKIYDLKV
jgi:hypothetical protein